MATVVGLFDTRIQVENAIDKLKRQGYRPEDISIVMRNPDEAKAMQEHEGVGGATATGVVSGGILGGLAGLLVGLGALAIPGIGPVIAAGPLIAAITGGALGAATGGLIGALVDAGIPEEEAHHYHAGVQRGGILLAVKVPDGQEPVVRTLLQEAGMRNIHQDAARWQQNPNWRYGTNDNTGTVTTVPDTLVVGGGLEGSQVGLPGGGEPAATTGTGVDTTTGFAPGYGVAAMALDKAVAGENPDEGQNSDQNDKTAGAGTFMGGASNTGTGMAGTGPWGDDTGASRDLGKTRADDEIMVEKEVETGTVPGVTMGTQYYGANVAAASVTPEVNRTNPAAETAGASNAEVSNEELDRQDLYQGDPKAEQRGTPTMTAGDATRGGTMMPNEFPRKGTESESGTTES